MWQERTQNGTGEFPLVIKSNPYPGIPPVLSTFTYSRFLQHTRNTLLRSSFRAPSTAPGCSSWRMKYEDVNFRRYYPRKLPPTLTHTLFHTAPRSFHLSLRSSISQCHSVWLNFDARFDAPEVSALGRNTAVNTSRVYAFAFLRRVQLPFNISMRFSRCGRAGGRTVSRRRSRARKMCCRPANEARKSDDV